MKIYVQMFDHLFFSTIFIEFFGYFDLIIYIQIFNIINYVVVKN